MRWCWWDRIRWIRRWKWIKSSLDFIWTRFSSLATQTLPTKTELQLTSPPASSHWEVIFFSSPRNLFLSSATQLSAEAKKLYMTAVHGVQKSSSISPQKPERPETPKVWTKRASKTVQRRFLKPPPVIPQITSRCSQSYYFFDKCYCLVINLSLKQTLNVYYTAEGLPSRLQTVTVSLRSHHISPKAVRNLFHPLFTVGCFSFSAAWFWPSGWNYLTRRVFSIRVRDV